jgi:arsenate reductase
MDELGIDISGQRSKNISEFLGKVTVRHPIIVYRKAEQQCPSIWPFSAEIVKWPLDDPAELTSEDVVGRFRRIRDDLQLRIRTWMEKI